MAVAQTHLLQFFNDHIFQVPLLFFTSVVKPSPFFTLQELKPVSTLAPLQSGSTILFVLFDGRDLTFAVCNPRLVPETEVSESYTHCTGTAENTLMLLYIQVYDWILASVPPANPQHYLLILSRIVRSIWLNYPHGTGVIHSLTDTSVSTFQPLS